MSRLGEQLRTRRRELGWRPVDIARQGGYLNVNKGVRRYQRIEDGRDIFPDRRVLRRFTAAMGIDDAEAVQAMAEDFCELDRPVSPKVIVRMMPAIYIPLRLPDGCSREEAEAIATDYARTKNRRVCVTLSRIRGLYIKPDGTRFEAYGLPASTLGHTAEALRLSKAAARIPVEKGSENGTDGM